MSGRLASDTGPFAVMPDWLLRADISDRAVRLFAVLWRYADTVTHEAFPSRRVLAQALRTSPDSVDRATKELVALGAVHVAHRINAIGDRTSNLYTLILARPAAERAVPSCSGSTPMSSRTAAATAGRSRAATVAAPVRHRTIPTGSRKRSSEEDLSTESVFAEQFWSAYPKKVGRKTALAAFIKLNPDAALLETILAALRRHAAVWAGRESRFIPHPATWLNGERWLDEVESLSPAKTGSGRTGPPSNNKYAALEIHDVAVEVE